MGCTCVCSVSRVVRARGVPGGYGVRAGWVYRVGNTGPTQPVNQPRCSRRTQKQTSEAGPGRPTGPGVGGSAGPDVLGTAARTGYIPTLRARSVHPRWPSLGYTPWNAASWPIWRDLTTFPVKLVKTAECHRNSCKRPVIVPISKTGSKSRLLKF